MAAAWTTFSQWRRRDDSAPPPAEDSQAVRSLARSLAISEHDRQRLTTEATARAAFLLALLRELRIPLNTVSGFVQLLEMNARADPLSPRQAQAVREMARASAELTGLIDEAAAFVDAHRPLPPPAPRRIDLRLAARTACDGLHGRAEAAGVELACSPPAPGLCALADPQRLRAALRALIDDAIRHAAPGAVVRIAAEAAGDRVRIVIGSGAVTPPPSLAEAVDAEGRLVPGMGLSAAQRLAESMGGTLETLHLAHGAAHALSLPAAHAAPRAAVRLALYAGDGAAEIAFLRHAATQMGFGLQIAETPETALAQAQALRPDVVLVDLGRASRPGRSLKRRLSEHPTTFDLPVIALMDDAAPGAPDRLRAAGFAAVLHRPLEQEALAAVFAEALGGAPPSSVKVGPALDAGAAYEA